MVDTFRSDIAKQSFNNRFKILIIVLTAMFMAVLNTNIVNVFSPTITSFYNVPVGLSAIGNHGCGSSHCNTFNICRSCFGLLLENTSSHWLFCVYNKFPCLRTFNISNRTHEYFRIVQALGGAGFKHRPGNSHANFPIYEREGRVMRILPP